MVEPEPEIWVLVPHYYFVEQASCTNNTMVFSFQWTNSFWTQSWSQNLLNVAAGVGAKKFRCLELEPEIGVLAPQPWSQ